MDKMNIADKIRLIKSKCKFKKNVLFSKKDGWIPPLRKHLDKQKYSPMFELFDNINFKYFDLVLPLTNDDTRYLNNSHSHLSVNKKTLIPTNNAVDICDQKDVFSHFMNENGFENYNPKFENNVSIPYVIKKKVGEWGEGISIIKNKSEERNYHLELHSSEYYKQEYIEGKKESTTHIIISDGKIIYDRTIEFFYNENYYIKGKDYKPKSSRMLESNPLIIRFERILNKLEFQGICCFNYKKARGKVYILEINPRFGSSLMPYVNEVIECYLSVLKG
jgi:carbamoylphosphate synthase large subunit